MPAYPKPCLAYPCVRWFAFRLGPQVLCAKPRDCTFDCFRLCLKMSDLSETDAVQTQDESVLRQQRLRWGFGVRRCVALAVSVFLLRDAFGL